MEPGDELDPLVATKRCRLGLVDGRPGLRPAVRGTFFRASSRATCGEGHVHRVPEPNCTCGFYALHDSDELADRLGPWRPEEVELDVELTGRVVVHEKGLRGEEQTVLGVRVHPMCALCTSRTPRPTVVVGRVDSGRRADWDGLLPLCDLHATAASELWTMAGLAAALETEVIVDHGASRAQPSRRLTSRTRLRMAVGATIAAAYLVLGLIVAIRGVRVVDPPEPQVAEARQLADDLAVAISGTETDVDLLIAEARTVAEASLDRTDVMLTASLGGGVLVRVDLGDICVIRAENETSAATSITEDGPCPEPVPTPGDFLAGDGSG
ncbi:MAG: hypothetical protein AAGD18_04590 [Actinomycetota bacterium]